MRFTENWVDSVATRKMAYLNFSIYEWKFWFLNYLRRNPSRKSYFFYKFWSSTNYVNYLGRNYVNTNYFYYYTNYNNSIIHKPQMNKKPKSPYPIHETIYEFLE